MAKKRRKETHICAYCGRTFKARAGALYCSASCRNTAAKVKRELKASQEKSAEANFKPAEAKTQPVGTIQYPQREITQEEAKQAIWNLISTAGLIWVVDKVLFGHPTKKRTRR